MESLKPIAAAIERCSFQGDAAHGSPRVWAVDTGAAAGSASHEVARTQVRRLARAALCEVLAPMLEVAADDLAVSDDRGQPPQLMWRGSGPPPWQGQRASLSIAHATGISLIAFCLDASVGVDAQAWPWDADGEALRQTAALFLAPDQALALDTIAEGAPLIEALATLWARHAARLKAARLPLTEWTPALQARLAPYRTAPLSLPDWPACGHLSAAVAWA